jgi:hypothetical protein
MGEQIKEIQLNIAAIINSPNFDEEVRGTFDKIETERGFYYAPSSKNTKRIGVKTVGLSLPVVFLAPTLALGAIPLIDFLVKGRKAKELYGEEFDPSSCSEGVISLPFDNLKRTLLTDVKVSMGLKFIGKVYSDGFDYTLISYQGNAIINGIEVPVEIETAGKGKAKEFAKYFQDRRPELNPTDISLKEFSRKKLIASL